MSTHLTSRDTATTTTAPRAPRRPLGGVTLAFVRCELARRLTRQTLVFTLLLPAVLYLALFRTGATGAGAHLPHGNFAAWMMVGIAVYGAATSSTSAAAVVSVERSSGWMRTLRLSPLTPAAYVVTKVLCSVLLAVLPVVVVGVFGAVTGVRADARVWVVGLLVAWAGSAVFAALGIGLGLALKPEVVLHMPGLIMTGLAFLGNLFIPLSGTMLEISRYTPVYGVATLARYPLDEGYSFTGDHASLAGALLNVAVWLVVFSLSAARRFRRGTGRV